MHRSQFPISPVAHPGAVVGGAGVKYRFTLLTEGLLRYEYADDGIFEDRASTFAIHRDLPVPKYRVLEKDDLLEIITPRLRLTYDKKPFSTNGLKLLVGGQVSDWHSVWRYGEEVHDLGGTARTLDGADGRIPLGPGIMNRNGYGVIDDSDTMLFENDGWVGPRKDGKRIDGYIFSYANDYREALKAFYDLSGKPPLLPRWSLGNWWSRYYAYSADEYLKLMDKFAEEEVPLSVGVIDMDWHHVDIDIKYGSGWTGYSWNRDLFPRPSQFLEKLHDKDIKVTLNVHPAEGVRAYEDSYQEMATLINHDTSEEDPIPFDVTDRKLFDAYFDVLHRDLEEDGVDFWWLDWQQGPYSRISGIDPLWMLNHYHFLDNAFDSKRPITFSRYAGPGSHRYPVGFSGDTVVTWASLDFQPEFTAKASNIGYGWWSHDIGGHMLGGKSDEMAARWVQLGCFSPILRLHSSNNPFNTKEPWTFNPEACRVMKKFMQLRHRMIPYLHTMNYLSARDGTPLIQPMYYDHPAIDEAYHYPNQFLFGSSLIVAPITAPASPVTLHAATTAWLPEGRFLDIFGGAVYDGDRTISFHRALDAYPVLAAEGAIIPLDIAAVPGNGGKNPEGIELLIIPGKDGKFDLLEDDGLGSRVEEVNTLTTTITYTQDTGSVVISPASYSSSSSSSKQTNAIPSKRDWKITFPSLATPPLESSIKITVDNETISTSDLKAIISTAGLGFSITLPLISTLSTISLSIGSNAALKATSIPGHLYGVIDRAQMNYDWKKQIWDVVRAKRSKEAMVSKLMALRLDKEVLDVCLEFVLADQRSQN
jgi:alpha-glucosidase (family GH31 glycosyl hydrolase)